MGCGKLEKQEDYEFSRVLNVSNIFLDGKKQLDLDLHFSQKTGSNKERVFRPGTAPWGVHYHVLRRWGTWQVGLESKRMNLSKPFDLSGLNRSNRLRFRKDPIGGNVLSMDSMPSLHEYSGCEWCQHQGFSREISHHSEHGGIFGSDVTTC